MLLAEEMVRSDASSNTCSESAHPFLPPSKQRAAKTESAMLILDAWCLCPSICRGHRRITSALTVLFSGRSQGCTPGQTQLPLPANEPHDVSLRCWETKGEGISKKFPGAS